jgi:hypothetical protein
MKNVFINCSAKEFYEELKPLLLTLEGYTMYEDEWNKGDEGCRIDPTGYWYSFAYRKSYEDIDLPDFIAAVKPKQPVDLRNRFIPCTEEQVDEVCDLLDKLGFKAASTESREWAEVCNGVQVFPTKNYQAYVNFADYPTLTLEELREIANHSNP